LNLFKASLNQKGQDCLKRSMKLSAMGWTPFAYQFRQIEGKLWEIKVSTHRIFYVVIEREEMVLLHVYKKQGQKLPIKERDIATRRMKELLS
jgi:phage-related protein